MGNTVFVNLDWSSLDSQKNKNIFTKNKKYEYYIMKNRFYYNIIYISILILVVFFCFCSFSPFQNSRENIQGSSQNEIELVVSRYNEDLEWLKEDPFNKYPVICYDKGSNNEYYQPTHMQKIHLENIGRIDHTILYHIITNYDSLATVSIFLPGSLNMEHKKAKAIQNIQEVETHKDSVFIGYYHKAGVRNELYNFSLDEWKASDSKNASMNSETTLELAKERPFGKWYDSHFNDIRIDIVSFYGIFAVSKKHILQHPKSYYENLIKELSNSSNPEVGHYFERSWCAVFHPLEGAKFIY